MMLAIFACLTAILPSAGHAMTQNDTLVLEFYLTQERSSLPDRGTAPDRGRTGRGGSKSDDEDYRPARSQTRPLPEIVARVQATPPYSDMDYIGVAGFEVRSMAYVLRFLDGRQVVVVHVDARSGRVISRMP